MAVHGDGLARLTAAEQRKVIGNPHRGSAYGQISGLFEGEDADHDPDQPELELKRAIKARSVRELATYINDHVRFNPAENDLPNLFPAAAVALEEARDDDLAPVYITYDHVLKESAKDRKVRTYGVMSWRRADGRNRSKTCDWSRIGIVAAGRDRGDAFRVCVNRDKCVVHFKESATRAKRRKVAPATTSSPASSGSDAKRRNAEAAAEKKRQAEEAHEQRVQDVWLKLIQERAPEWARDVNAIATQLKLPEFYRSWMASSRFLERDLEDLIQYNELDGVEHTDVIFETMRPKLDGGWSKAGDPETAAAQPVGMALLFWLQTKCAKLKAALRKNAETWVKAEEAVAAKKAKAAKKPATKKAKKGGR